MLQVNVHQAKTNLSKLIQKVIDGEEVIIAKGNRPIVKLVPFNHHTPERRFGSALGKIIISDNFDEPIDGFKEYMP